MDQTLAQALATVLDDTEELSAPATPPSLFGAAAEPILAAVLVLLCAEARQEQQSEALGAGSQQTPIRRKPEGSLENLSVVLTRRRADLSHHAGEIAFPGGRRDPADRTLLQTALREAKEEIGLDSERAHVIGALAFAHTLATNFAVRPYVALLDGHDNACESRAAGPTPPARSSGSEQAIAKAPGWIASAREVDAVLEVPLSELAETRENVKMTRRGITFHTEVFHIGQEIVWGLTHRILEDLMQRIDTLA